MALTISLHVGDELRLEGKSLIVREVRLNRSVVLVNKHDPDDELLIDFNDVQMLHQEHRLFLVPPARDDDKLAPTLPRSHTESAYIDNALLFVRHALRDRPKLRYSKAFLDGVTREVMANHPDAIPYSSQTVKGWIEKYLESGEHYAALTPQFHKRGGGHRKQPEFVHEVAERIIDQCWLDLERMGIALLQSTFRVELRKRANELGVEVPEVGDNFLYRKAHAIGIYERLARRVGKRVAKRSMAAVWRGPDGGRPLAEVEMDATLLDIMVVHPHLDIVMGRPWLTVMLDRRTRLLLGFYISFDPPSWLTVMGCLRNAITPKSKFLESLGGEFENEWPSGVPDALFVDQAAESRSAAIEQAAFRLGIVLNTLPRASPWLKGKVERFLGTLQGQIIHWIPGTTFSSIQARGDYTPELYAFLRLNDLHWLVTKYIVDEYNVRPHGETGRIPLSHFKEETRTFGLRPSPDPELLTPLISIPKMVKVTRKGFSFKGIQYNSRMTPAILNRAKLRLIAEKYPKELQSIGGRMNARIDPNDLGTAWVQDDETGEWIEFASLDPDYANGLTLHQHSVLSAEARAQLDEDGKLVRGDLHSAKSAMQTLVREKLAEAGRKRISKRLARFMNIMPATNRTEKGRVDPIMSSRPLVEEFPWKDHVSDVEPTDPETPPRANTGRPSTPSPADAPAPQAKDPSKEGGPAGSGDLLDYDEL